MKKLFKSQASVRRQTRSITQPDSNFQRKFQHKQQIYTDGSKKGTSLAAAVYHLNTGNTWQLKCTNHEGQLNTPLRGELAAIHFAVNHVPNDQPQILFTDSLTGMYLISAMIQRPHALIHHKHKHILTEIVQTLLTRTAPIEIHKVKAHSGILGNEAADKAANAAHETGRDYNPAPDTPFINHWVQHNQDAAEPDTLWNVDNLRDHTF